MNKENHQETEEVKDPQGQLRYWNVKLTMHFQNKSTHKVVNRRVMYLLVYSTIGDAAKLAIAAGESTMKHIKFEGEIEYQKSTAQVYPTQYVSVITYPRPVKEHE